MKEIRVSTESIGTPAINLITRIVTEMWQEKQDAFDALLQYKQADNWTCIDEERTGNHTEVVHAEGVMAGLDIAMDIITATVLPDYFGCPTRENSGN